MLAHHCGQTTQNSDGFMVIEKQGTGVLNLMFWKRQTYYFTDLLSFLAMGTCNCVPEQPLKHPPSNIHIEIRDVIFRKADQELIKEYAQLRSEAASFPLTNHHVQQKIDRFSKFKSSSNKIWRLNAPYNLFYMNQATADQYCLPKGYAKIYKVKESGEFSGYYEGNVTRDFKPDLKLGFFVFPNASYFQGTGTDKGRYTNQVTNLTYEGDWINQQPHGRGKEKNNKGEYEGDYYQGEKHGKGKFVWNDGSSFFGSFLKGVIHGKGSYTNLPLKYSYQGQYSKDCKHGRGVETKDKEVYEGDFYNSQRCGQGKLLVYQDQEKQDIKYSYEGIFKDNKPHGNGTYIDFRSEKRVHGIWNNGVLIAISE